MEIIRGLPNIRERHEGCVATIGTFDGVHLGHKQLLTSTKKRAVEFNTQSLLVTFEPQPREYFRGSRVPARLTRFREKVALFDQEGIDQVLCIPFNERTSSIHAQAVIEQFFVRMLSIRHLVVGDDFRFGSNAEGDFDMLKTAGKRHGFGVDQIPTLELDGKRVSSTLIREVLARGDLNLASKLLGRRYFMMGTVVKGRQIGKTLGVPTANIRLQRYRSAIEGIFAVTVQGLGRDLRGSAYVGTRPTIQGTDPLLEVHLFDFDRDLYGSRLKITFLKKFRDDRAFGSIEELQEQMFQDLSDIRTWFDSHDETRTVLV
ncbi:MAG: bifunctional riboflavin kinase/FAD synthetase [Gammaproteobacteria bacterium]|nr:bifunctional riboflavin kinase/FAD synthetase [Gammaproteobacteria bacterium]